MRWSVSQRREFIEHCLFWEGRFRKSDLRDRFSISLPQASADVKNYLEEVPGAMRYDSRKRVYLASPGFQPRHVTPNSNEYLTQLLLVADSALVADSFWLGSVPSHAAIPRVRRQLNESILRSLVRAIHGEKAIEIRYQSMSSLEPKVRWIAPHSLVFDGHRWHVRSWCFNRSAFGDFVIARIMKVMGDRPAEVSGTLDRAWNEHVTLRLAPHPELSETQRKIVELDYGMEDGCISIKMRVCLSYYFERRWLLDLGKEIGAPRVQVVLQNADEVARIRRSCGLLV